MELNRIFVGIDPGKDGGVSALHPDGTFTYHKMPKIGTEVDLTELVQLFRKYENEGNVLFGLEDVHSIPGVAASSSAKLMELKGIKEGILVALKLPYVKVHSKTWQKVSWLNVPPIKKSNGKNDTKATSLMAIKRLYPNQTFIATERSSVPHDGIVDASLIAHYLKQTYR